MPAHVHTNVLETALLMQLGSRLVQARKEKGLSATAVAAELGVSRNTLKAAESGDPSVTMGTYVRILSVLGRLPDLALVATGVAQATSKVAPVALDDPVARRHAQLEREVSEGSRDARSLVTGPADMARRADVVFPKDAFGKAKPW